MSLIRESGDPVFGQWPSTFPRIFQGRCQVPSSLKIGRYPAGQSNNSRFYVHAVVGWILKRRPAIAVFPSSRTASETPSVERRTQGVMPR